MEEQQAQSTEAMAIAVKAVMENKYKESELVSLSPDMERGMTTSFYYFKALEATKSEVQAEIAALCAKVSRKEAQ
jgi:hypothetical protein